MISKTTHLTRAQGRNATLKQMSDAPVTFVAQPRGCVVTPKVSSDTEHV